MPQGVAEVGRTPGKQLRDGCAYLKKCGYDYAEASSGLLMKLSEEELRGAALLECRLTTGRTHQIRVHMASIGHPLLGDPVYGPKRMPYPVAGGQLLHAFRIGFVHPHTGEEMCFEAPPEPRFLNWLQKLRP